MVVSMITIHEVAKKAGVSVATVSRVINSSDKVAPETAKRVHQVIQQLGYQPNAAARALRTARTYVIGLVVSDLANPFFAAVVKGAEKCAQRYGYALLVCNSDETTNKEQLYLRLLGRRHVDGLLLIPSDKEDADFLNSLIQRGTRIVLIDRKVEGVSAPVILSKNEEGAYQAVSYLIQKGHKRIGIVLGLPNLGPIKERFLGYKKALLEHGIKMDPSLIAYGNSQIKGGKEACFSLLKRSDKPTALFVTNILMSIGILKALRQLRLRCPDDISIIGFDDYECTDIFDPPLTTVAQRPYYMGYKATQVLLDIVRNNRKEVPQEIRVDVVLRVRASVRSLRGGDVKEKEPLPIKNKPLRKGER